MTLKEAIAWVLSQGGAGMVAFWIVEKIISNNWRADHKRYIAFVLTAAIACGSFYFATVMGYMPTPQTWRGWIEQLFQAASGAILVSQVAHAAIVLRRVRHARA
jgi:hypothetical protein